MGEEISKEAAQTLVMKFFKKKQRFDPTFRGPENTDKRGAHPIDRQRGTGTRCCLRSDPDHPVPLRPEKARRDYFVLLPRLPRSFFIAERLFLLILSGFI